MLYQETMLLLRHFDFMEEVMAVLDFNLDQFLTLIQKFNFDVFDG
jgi:hypothetical protein